MGKRGTSWRHSFSIHTCGQPEATHKEHRPRERAESGQGKTTQETGRENSRGTWRSVVWSEKKLSRTGQRRRAGQVFPQQTTLPTEETVKGALSRRLSPERPNSEWRVLLPHYWKLGHRVAHAPSRPSMGHTGTRTPTNVLLLLTCERRS